MGRAMIWMSNYAGRIRQATIMPGFALLLLGGNAYAQTSPAAVPHDLSPWAMFLAADIVVKGVMSALALASVIVWTIFVGKMIELRLAKRRTRRASILLSQQPSLSAAGEQISKHSGIANSLVQSAKQEIALSEMAPEKEGIKERVQSRLSGLVGVSARSAAAGTGVLATIGATAPFVGLFGTVWGIMNSFIGISKAQTTNLAVVAPGIAEALLATAIGLVAAIPAVIFYNHLSRSIGSYRALVNDTAEEVMRLVSRDLDRNSARQNRFVEGGHGRQTGI